LGFSSDRLELSWGVLEFSSATVELSLDVLGRLGAPLGQSNPKLLRHAEPIAEKWLAEFFLATHTGDDTVLLGVHSLLCKAVFSTDEAVARDQALRQAELMTNMLQYARSLRRRSEYSRYPWIQEYKDLLLFEGLLRITLHLLMVC
jgi:hypothetical protein